MTESQQTPSVKIEWHHEGYREVWVYLEEGLVDDPLELSDELRAMAETATVDDLRGMTTALATGRGWRVLTFAAGPDHLDPLANRIAIGIGRPR